MTQIVIPHDPAWAMAYASEASRIARALAPYQIEIHHIGSTAIPDILAKPVIDMLGVVSSIETLDTYSGQLDHLGYEAKGAFGIQGRRFFQKLNPSGVRTHHLHLFEEGTQDVLRHLAFRDFLRHHPDIAADYSALKSALTSNDVATREDYVARKAPYVTLLERRALTWRESLGDTSLSLGPAKE